MKSTLCLIASIICCASFSAQIVESNETEFSIHFDQLGPECDVQWASVFYTFEGHPHLDFIYETNATSYCEDYYYGGSPVTWMHLAYGSTTDPFMNSNMSIANISPFGEAVRNLPLDFALDYNATAWGANTVQNTQYQYGYPINSWNFSGNVGFYIQLGTDRYFGYFGLVANGWTGQNMSLDFGTCYINTVPNTPIIIGEVPPACPSDASGDGVTDVDDFIMFNSAFGTNCSGCAEDMNGDGHVDVDDFLILNSAFGTDCE